MARQGESHSAYLKRLAEAEGIDAEDGAALRRMDCKHRKKMSNEVWENPNDPEAEITGLEYGRTALAFKAENAVGWRREPSILGELPAGIPRLDFNDFICLNFIAVSNAIFYHRNEVS